MITLTMNGQQGETEQGQTLLEVAKSLGIEIPTLCHHPAIPPAGACRICMVEIARYFTDFLRKESCGKCTACREGVLRMYELLEKITSGNGTTEDIELLEEVSLYVRDNSICGLGKSAPNPTLSTLKYFRDEYMAHVVDRKCPAGVCRELTTFVIDQAKCKACGQCLKQCPTSAIVGGEKKVPAGIELEKCIKCGLCREACKFDAVMTE